MPVSLNLETARRLLDSAWKKVDDPAIQVSPSLLMKMKKLVSADNVTYKYIVVTGLLAKSVTSQIHPRALQAGSKLKGAYDARSLCHKVIVQFEKTKGNLWGLSNEPFLNKPARHPEHDKNNPQLRDAPLASCAHDILEAAKLDSSENVFNLLVTFLALSKEKAGAQITPTYISNPTLGRLLLFLERFLMKSDGGARLAAVTGAFITLLNPGFKVRVYAPNVSDKFAKTAGDIEIVDGVTLLSAFECKDRLVTLDDIRHGIRKARTHSLREYCFVYSVGLAEKQTESIQNEVREVSATLDVWLISIHEAVRNWTTALNPIRRSKYIDVLVRILRDDMRLSNTASEAASIWNSLEEGGR